ncbi:PIG-L family deacetylase [Dyadobacter sp. 676]|uniref:PIG-L family deacetylase n=1 Tax=Dyadobacter sp. 676 TaxID=3088362 RepID=A0AAU8FJ43_9BACT
MLSERVSGATPLSSHLTFCWNKTISDDLSKFTLRGFLALCCLVLQKSGECVLARAANLFTVFVMNKLFYVSLFKLLSGGLHNEGSHTGKVSNKEAGRVIMAIVAHPDDELLMGTLLSHYATRGVKVHIVIATNGALGQTDFYKVPEDKTLVEIRRDEMSCSCNALGLEKPILLGLPDQLLASEGKLQSQIDLLRYKIDSLFQFYQPDAVLTFGAAGMTGHPDHRLIGNIVTEVFESRSWPWKPKLFYPALPTGSINEKSWATYLTVDSSHHTVHISLDSIDYVRLGQAYQCHKSQYRESVRIKLPIFMKSVQKGQVMLRPFSSTEPLKNSLF